MPKDPQAPPLPEGTAPTGTTGAGPGANAGATGTTGGAATGADTGTGGKGGTRPKDVKVSPPPPQPQILQLTPDLFQQAVAAAVTAALSASQASQAVVPPPVATTPVIPRKEKKLAEFWTSRPVMWFRLFDGQFPNSMTEDASFNALLNHLPSSALPFVDHVLRDPGQNPFTSAKKSLVKHYEVSPRDRARTLRSLTSLGDKTPSEMLHYMRSLLPGVPDNALFEAIFLDLLPANARDAAVKHDTLEGMADAADKVLAEAPNTPAITAIDSAEGFQVQAMMTRKSSPRSASLCFVHRNYGRGAFKCASPKTCTMRDIITKPSNVRPASGNVNAGRH